MSTPVFDLSSLSGSNGFRVDGDEYSSSGKLVSNAGDINGDGFDDVIISAPGFDYDGSFVVFGKASGFDAKMNSSDLNGGDGFHLFSSSSPFNAYIVSAAGDINGDGFDDVIIGARGIVYNSYSDSRLHDGASYVVFGKSSGFTAEQDLSDLDGNNGFRLDLEGGTGGDFSVSSAGDVNGDGFDDVIVGVSDVSPYSQLDAGSSYVVFGKASGFDAHMNLSNLDGSNGFRLNGVVAGDKSGDSVSGAGDVNGDGFDDVIIGALKGGKGSGGYVVFGHATGFAADLDLSSLDGNNGFRLDNVASSFSGDFVSGAGDVNGDGFDDVIIGDPEAGLNGLGSGMSFVLFGRASGFSAAVDLADLDGNDGFSLVGVADFDESGRSVSDAGDINGDGYGDLIIGAPSTDSNGFFSGSSYVVFGRASGFGALMDLSSLDGSNGFRVDGESEFDNLGRSVSGAGDVNGDGLDDLLVGAPGVNPNNDYSGASYIIFGSRDFGNGGGGGGELPEIKGTDGDDTLKGSETAEHFIAGDGNDSLLGRGGADIFDAGAGDDAIRIGDLTFASIDGGDGNDALHLAGADLNLDLTALGEHIYGIETICLYGRGDNTLTLNADSLLNLSDSTNTLKVYGNSGDHIVVQGTDWADGGSHGFYHSYTHDDAVLLVGANVTLEFV